MKSHEPTKHRLDDKHHMSIRSRAGGRTSYTVYRETGIDSRQMLFSTAYKGDVIGRAVEHAREELRLFIERETELRLFIVPGDDTANKLTLDALMAALAQGVINIDEGHTTIEHNSRIYNAMVALCELARDGKLAIHDKADALLAAHDVLNAANAIESRLELSYEDLSKLTKQLSDKIAKLA